MAERKKVGLALGSGGAKGLAHVGVLKVLEKYNIPIDMIAGTSIGAVIGAFYAADTNAKKLEKMSLEFEWKKIFDYTLPKEGLIKGEKIEGILDEKLGNIDFKDLKIPLFITAYDLNNNQEIIFSKGNVAKAIRSSMSIPGVFIPVENNKQLLVDGGIVDPIPTEILKKAGAEVIIAVNVNSVKTKKPKENETAIKGKNKESHGILHTVLKSLEAIETEMSKYDLENSNADFIINIEFEDQNPLDFSNIPEKIKKGEAAIIRSLREIEKKTEPHMFKSFLMELDSLGISKALQNVKRAGKKITQEIKKE